MKETFGSSVLIDIFPSNIFLTIYAFAFKVPQELPGCLIGHCRHQWIKPCHVGIH